MGVAFSGFICGIVSDFDFQTLASILLTGAHGAFKSERCSLLLPMTEGFATRTGSVRDFEIF